MTRPGGSHRYTLEVRVNAPGADGRPEPTAAGTLRRLRALAARSWSPREIEYQTGLSAMHISTWLEDRGAITAQDARAVAAAYDRLWNLDPPCITEQQRRDARAAGERAARSGWAPPLAWDDDQIDLPAARPAPGWKPHRSTIRAADLVEDADFIRQNGGYQDAPMSVLGMRLGVSGNRLEQAHVRARRYAARQAAAQAEAEAG
jgi:hypothetical protein